MTCVISPSISFLFVYSDLELLFSAAATNTQRTEGQSTEASSFICQVDRFSSCFLFSFSAVFLLSTSTLAQVNALNYFLSRVLFSSLPSNSFSGPLSLPQPQGQIKPIFRPVCVCCILLLPQLREVTFLVHWFFQTKPRPA